MRRSLGALSANGTCCGHCRRNLLAGETLRELDSGRQVCELCFIALPSDRRFAVSSMRVRASERPLDVAPKAA